MRPKWSQNFLVDAHIANRCVDSLELEPADPVLEIGPGRGVLTRILAERTGDITAVEIDPDLALRLKTALPRWNSSILSKAIFWRWT